MWRIRWPPSVAATCPARRWCRHPRWGIASSQRWMRVPSCAGKPAMSETSGFKPKKSVALSGVTAGNTALSTVGRTGNDLHYRGYDILEIAGSCEFEEIAYLLIHEKLPNRAELAAYKAKLRS